MDKLNPDDSRAPYLQIADALRAEIDKGEYEPGAKLPAHKAVATRFGVSVGTVKQAFARLQAAELIVSRQGQGSFVRTQRPDSGVAAGSADSVSLAEVQRQLEDLGRRLAAVEDQLRRD
ncbi:GntR family transcriptional regulator [Crossiella sp. CA198]|uniref:GntR family transcriptional regulator n=1 Tax=Crossiella sp. CA198 TaxID=3455607 RepID=UPI003F8D0854